jgi:histidine ammonia-lyase
MATDPKRFHYGEDRLTISAAHYLVKGEWTGIISRSAREKIRHSQERVQKIAENDLPVYGINTGFGPLCTTRISPANTRLLQSNLLKSHATGVGEPLSPHLIRLMLILKVHALSLGSSGIAENTLDRLLWHLEQDILPRVPGQGSLGASGDLAPLAHLFLPLIGLGEVEYQGSLLPAAEVLQKENLPPLELGPKEGLALINGTQFITAHATEVLLRLGRCLSQADLVGALMVEGLMGSASPFRPELHRLRPHRGCQHVAARLHTLLQGSEIGAAHAECDRVQDPYSMRCMPQVHGASREAWLHLRQALEVEIHSVTDNPVILENGDTISGGNFHGQPLALPLDYVTLAAAELGSISERRSYLSLEGTAPQTPKLLMTETGINSGFMILQYTAAALVSENKSLCFPASADSIPTSLGQEDHVSMGSISARKVLRIVENLENILAIELLCAAQAFDFKRPLRSGKILEAIHAAIRSHISHAPEDRFFGEDLKKAVQMVRSGRLKEIAGNTAHQYHIPFKTEFDELFELPE